MTAPISLKELSKKPDLFTSGHRLCDGCAAPIALKQILLAAENPPVMVSPTCCTEISSAVYPFTSWAVPWYHNAFENAGAVLSGIESAYKALQRTGKMPKDKKFSFIAFGGDGGTYDIGFQSLSGALERRHKMLYVCYDNGAYMNTGIQRSGATPFGAWTTTSYAGSAYQGKTQPRKDLVSICAEHGAYAANASISHWRDFMNKVKTALAYDGPSFIAVTAPCQRGWRFDSNLTIEIARLAVETRWWPLFEVKDGKWTINYTPKKDLPVTEFLKPQGRFAHFFKKGNEHLIEEFQKQVDEKWAQLVAKSKMWDNVTEVKKEA